MNKSRSGVREKGAVTAIAAPIQPPVKEVVPGRFNENDWIGLLQTDVDVDVVAEILDGLVFATWDTISQRQVEQKVFPFTVEWAKDIVEQIVEWQFLERDDGEMNAEGDQSWLEDEEPVPSEIDSWARGVVPKTKVILKKRKETVNTELKAEEESFEINQFSADGRHLNDKEEEEGEESEKKVSGATDKMKDGFLAVRRTRKKLKSTGDDVAVKRKGKERGKFNASETATQAQIGRPPGMKQVSYDSRGNVIHAVKLNPSHFPSHIISTKYSLVDLGSDRRRLQHVSLSKPKVHPPSLHSMDASSKGQSDPIFLPRTLIDSVDAAPGVIVREGDKVKEGVQPKQLLGLTQTRKLRSVVPVGNGEMGLERRDAAESGHSLLHTGVPVVRLLGSTHLRSLPVVFKEGQT
eukprot:m.3289 g.3289  ORF g.3289 m.3289 type:complete len:407 (+) comp9230_c0_seq1:47-1267(+)